MYRVKELFDKIVIIADILEKNDIDNFKFPKGISEESVKNWEKENHAFLPQGYKEFLLLANGFRMHGSEIYPLEQVTRLDFPDEFKGYYAIGSYIGDGSLILADNNGKFYLGDHADGIEESTFEAFVKRWILEGMEEAVEENGIHLP